VIVLIYRKKGRVTRGFLNIAYRCGILGVKAARGGQVV
jgi:hypothetical protein